jgi:hypothetical protein
LLQAIILLKVNKAGETIVLKVSFTSDVLKMQMVLPAEKSTVIVPCVAHFKACANRSNEHTGKMKSRQNENFYFPPHRLPANKKD